MERTGNYQYNYHYDGTAGSGCAGFSYPEGVTLANIFTAKTRNGKTASCKITVQAVTDQEELNMPELYHVSNQESGIRLKWKKYQALTGMIYTAGRPAGSGSGQRL